MLTSLRPAIYLVLFFLVFIVSAQDNREPENKGHQNEQTQNRILDDHQSHLFEKLMSDFYLRSFNSKSVESTTVLYVKSSGELIHFERDFDFVEGGFHRVELEASEKRKQEIDLFLP